MSEHDELGQRLALALDQRAAAVRPSSDDPLPGFDRRRRRRSTRRAAVTAGVAALALVVGVSELDDRRDDASGVDVASGEVADLGDGIRAIPAALGDGTLAATVGGRVLVVDAGGAVHWLSEGDHATDLALSTDGRWLTWTTRDGDDRWVAPADGSAEPRRLASGGPGAWSPTDGTRLAAVDRDGRLLLLEPEAEPVVLVGDDPSTGQHPPVWSPDGTHIAMAQRSGAVYLTPLERGDERVPVVAGLVGVERVVAWLPGDRLLVLGYGEDGGADLTLDVVQLAGLPDAPQVLERRFIDVVPDGQGRPTRELVAVDVDGGHVWVAAVAGPEPRLERCPLGPVRPVDPDGDRSCLALPWGVGAVLSPGPSGTLAALSGPSREVTDPMAPWSLRLLHPDGSAQRAMPLAPPTEVVGEDGAILAIAADVPVWQDADHLLVRDGDRIVRLTWDPACQPRTTCPPVIETVVDSTREVPDGEALPVGSTLVWTP